MDLGNGLFSNRFIYFCVFILTTCFQLTAQNVRHKRAATGNEPSIVTQGGNMIFQTGRNHNITFQSDSGGFINLNGQNLNGISQQVQDNKAAITQLQTNPSVPPDLTARVTQVESRLSNLVPTGQVATKFADLTTRTGTLETSVRDNKAAITVLQSNPSVPAGLTARVTQVESRLNNLVPTGQVATKFADLTTRMRTLETNVPLNVNSRLSQVENGLSNLQPTGPVASRLNSLDQRVTSIDTRVRNIESSSDVTGLRSSLAAIERNVQRTRGPNSFVKRRQMRRLTRRVQTLTNTLTRIQTALTTDECLSFPCQHGGTCIDQYNRFHCECPRQSWTGARCDVDVNECAEFAGSDLGCQHGGNCINTQGSYRCECPANWHGFHCTESHEDCTGASNEALCGHGTCVNKQRVVSGQPKYTCICEQGWSNTATDPACVIDVNECSDPSPHCSQDPLVQCINVPGTFYCGPCPAGYSGNGFSCVDIDECLSSNGGCSVAPRVQCINTPGSRRCGPCPPVLCTVIVACCVISVVISAIVVSITGLKLGYQGNGDSCTFVGVCNQNNGGCSQFATCVENQGIAPSYRVCQCRSGYTGNGVGSNGCVPETTTGACSSHPCRHGGICSASGSSFSCSCQAGYTGSSCETDINDCATTPCQNSGICSDRINGFVCNCTSDWTGSTCTERQETCGGALTGESGSLTYPRQTGTTYPHGLSCAWSITTTRGKVLTVIFSRFNLEFHVNCNYDFLQAHDGPTASSHQIGKYCGSTLPNNGTITSTHNQIYFWLKTDASVAQDGFALSWTSGDPVCGGDLSADFGTINSPGYPGRYPHNRDCVWTVSVPPGNNIMFTFATLQIETHPNCSYDYLEFRDGFVDTSSLLQRYCSSVSPAPVSTTGPYAWIKFHTDVSQNDVGFHITFAKIAAGAQCGGAMTNVSGSISSPGYPNPYQHNAQCVWTVTVAQGETISLTFSVMDLETHNSCQYDYVEVRDGPDEEANLIGRYCDTMPSVLSSTGNQLWIKFRSDQSLRGTGFRATYTTGCGGTYTTPTGTLTSPNYPQSYPSNKQCTYLINQPDGFTITLSFTAFDIEGTSNRRCSYDYLQVRDGGNEDGTSLGRFCGNQIPSAVSSTGNVMFLTFVTDGTVQNLGFSATYTSNEGAAGCGGTLTDTTGAIESPGHPDIYPHGANCTWFISVPSGLIIRLTFNTFSIEQHSSCRFDSVEIFDNSTLTDQGNSLGKYCGSSMPPVLTSSGNTMAIQLVSDASLAFGGFSASYTALNASAVCGSELTDSVGVITSPGYPGNYPHTRECVWTIVVGAGQQILLNVTNFRLENHQNCNYDYLEIRNGGYNTSPLIGKYCGTNIDPLIRSHSNRLYIKFRSDASLSAPGFRIVYDGTSSGCGADLTTPTGSFVSPNYPGVYSQNGECFWTITTSRGSKLQLVFVDMDIESHTSCRYDYLQVRDKDVNGVELGRLCGTQIPSPIMSNTNKLWVKFRADSSIAGRGFHAAYYSLCDTVLTDPSGVIESPNFPNPYPHSRNCTWLVQATLGNTINASFSHFDVESHSSCNFDYVQIRDGQDETAPLISTSCGTNIPDPVATTQQYMWVRFLSDASVAGNGFRLEYAMDGCGGYLNSATGRFTSPNYPNPYPHRRVCEWYITVTTGSAISLNISNFDLESHSECRFDSLKVYGGMDDSAPLLTTLCSRITSPLILATTGNRMFVRFTSDISQSGNGFQATYQTVTGGCGGNFTTDNGLITSKNYPNNYPHNIDCEWLITLQEGELVVLTFLDFQVEGSVSGVCSLDYVAVFDGDNQNATELLRHCGRGLPPTPVIRSTGNQMFIRMRSDGSVALKGFQAQYVKGCGGTLNADIDGQITSPGYPGLYDLASNCTWLLQAQSSSERITLTFTHMDIQNSNGCDQDYVQVLDGNSLTAPEVDSYCGTTVPGTITSQGSALYVLFNSDLSGQGSGFRATYSTSVSSCGGEFTAENGAFNSPSYPDSYPINTECVWTITASPGNKILIAFSMFDLEQHPDCDFDYLEIREGSLTGRLIGKYCGNDLPSNITALNGVWMKFRSDSSSTGVGFMAQYNTVYGGEVTGTSGQIASPLYPQQYPHFADYAWTITVAVGSRIRVTFLMLDMEGSTNCVYDYIRLRNGGDATSPILNSFCGTELPAPFISTTNQLRAEFHSDFSSTGSGFLFNWTVTSEVPLSSTTIGPSTTALPGCGGELVAQHDVSNFTSPGYPGRYRNNLDCTWQITAEPGHRIWLNITDISLESHSSCNYDVIKVYDAMFSSGRYLGSLAGEFCGRVGNEEPIVVTGNRMAVTFTTDISMNRRGFSIDYKSVCGGTIRNTPTGELHSANYPNNYDNSANCTWVITVAAGRTIQATFNTFNIQTSPFCDKDYIMLLNGNNMDSPPLIDTNQGQLCGSSSPSLSETASNSLYVSFISDGSQVFPGFSLTWNEVAVTCGGSLTLTNSITSSIFTSPNYPNNYPHNVDCIWIITAPASESIQIDFNSNFNIESHSSCRWDYIEIRDGGTENADMIGSYCGTTAPGTVLSTGNVMYARFRTDNSVPRIGFQATYKIATCGGTVNGDSGSLQSPNYPSAYGNNAQCVWIINGPVGHYLTFTFEAFNLQLSSNCSQTDFLEIREPNATGTGLLRPSCGSSLPSPVDTSDSAAYIRFVSDSSVTRSGFKVNFQANLEACGGDLTTPTGTFTSPNYPGLYAHSRVCEWRIRVQPGRRVTLVFNDFRLEDSLTCQFDRVEVYNGILTNSPRIARLCGQTPTQQESSGNTMLVRFRTDGSVSNGGFSATYTSAQESRCGNLLTVGSGNITSPGYQNGNYSHNEQCVWILQNNSPVNSSIALRFQDFQIEPHSRCIYDFLEVREGSDENGALYNRYCGNTSNPEPIVSPSQTLWIRFVSDASLTARGFDIQYSKSVCGGILSAENGVITSPNYPANYDHMDLCAWKIVAPEGNQIVVTFIEVNIENHPSCNFDYLEILNGGSPSSPSIGKYCGTTTPALFTSQSNQLRLNFRTDSSSAARGFRLSYRFSTEGCGGLYHGNQGLISSPNFPNRYPHNIECVWTITVQPGYHVALDFNSPFDLEAHTTCNYDYVQAFSIFPNSSMLAIDRKYCTNQVPPQQVSFGNQLALKMRTDASSAGNGFSANWTTGCGATFTANTGLILSPGFPDNYDNNLQCNYTVQIDPQKYVVLQFDDRNFDIESGTGCLFDYLQIYAGTNSSGRPLGKFCGKTPPQALSSLGSMFFQFVTDSSRTGTGWRANFTVSECGGVFTDSSGRLSSPTHPTLYHHNINCTYNITVDPNRVVRLKFNSFDIETHSRCNYDYIEVRDGNSYDSPLIGRFCGTTIPDEIKSTGRSMLLNFVTDVSVAREGWSASYSQTLGVNQGCGGVYNTSSGQIGSPDTNMDRLYDADLDCVWQLIVSPGMVVQISIPSLVIEFANDCNYDYLQINDGMSNQDPLVGKYCGNQTNFQYTASSNALYIKFHTDSSVARRGFNATFTQITPLCGGNFLAGNNTQTISAPSYPSSRTQPLNCRWVIDSPARKQVRLRFSAFNIADTGDCNVNYLEIRDRSLGDLGRSIHYCGTNLPPVFDSAGRTVQINMALSQPQPPSSFQMTYTIADCNKTYTGDNGRILSPGWPSDYPHSADCAISINSPQGTMIALYFNSFAIEAHPRCNYDYLQVYNGSDYSAPTIGQFCGRTLPDPIYSTANNLLLRLKTDSSVAYAGFDISYTSSPLAMGCGGNLSSDTGSFTSPNYPGNYTDGQTCDWNINVPARRVITLNFLDIGILGSADCTTDYVEVRKGTSSEFVARYCGDSAVADLALGTSKAFVRFVSDGIGSAVYFRLKFTS